MPATPTIYVHIGPPKTGTTYLQQVLWRNRRLLETRGVTFPGKGTAEHFRAACDLRGISFGGHDDPAVPGAWSRLAHKATAVSTPLAVISHEIFAGATADQVRTLTDDLHPCPVHVVYGARDLARQLPAVWQESLKNRGTRRYERFLATVLSASPDEPERGFWRAQEPVATLERWATVVPPERIHVLIVPQPGGPAGLLWERWCRALGVDADGYDLEVRRTNPSLGAADAELLRRLNRALPADLPWPEYAAIVKQRFNHWADRGTATDRLTVPATYRDRVLERTQQIQDSLASAGYDVVGDLADLTPADSAFATSDGPAPDRVTDAAVELLAHTLMREAAQPRLAPRRRVRGLMRAIRR